MQELSERLKAKSLKDKQTKKHPNEYEKEYSVSHRRFACSLITKPPETGGSPDPTMFFPKKNPSAKLDSCFASSCVIIVIAPLGNCQLLSEAVYTATQCTAVLDWSDNHLERSHRQMEHVRCRVFIWQYQLHLPFGRMASSNLGLAAHLTKHYFPLKIQRSAENASVEI